MERTANSRWAFTPGTCVDVYGTLALLSVQDFRYLARDHSLETWPNKDQRDVLVYGPDITRKKAISFAREILTKQVIAEAEFVDALLAFHNEQRAKEPPAFAYMQAGQVLCMEGTATPVSPKSVEDIMRLGLTVTDRIEEASVLILGTRSVRPRAEQQRARAMELGLPIVSESDFESRDIPRGLSDVRWQNLAAAMDASKRVTATQVIAAWQPQPTRFRLTL